MLDLPNLMLGLLASIVHKMTGFSDEVLPAALEDAAAPHSLVNWGQGIESVKPTEQESAYFKAKVEPKMLQSSIFGMLTGLWVALTSAFTLKVSDKDIGVLLNETTNSRLIAHDLTIDMTYHGSLTLLPGLYLPSVVAFIGQNKDTNLLFLESLSISNIKVSRGDKLWNLAKIYFLQSLQYETLFSNHSVIHIHNGYFEQAFHTSLPESNPLHIFLKSHFGYGFALVDTIIRIFHQHTSPGNPFALPVDPTLHAMAIGIKSFRYAKLNPEYVDSPINRALAKSQQVVRNHLADFFTHNIKTPEHLQEVKTFVSSIATHVSWIPRNDLDNTEIVIDVIARFLFEGSIYHGFDHIQLTDIIGIHGSVARLRKPFDGVNDWKASELIHRIDTFQRVVFQAVFHGRKHSDSILDVKYDERIQLTPGKFKNELLEVQKEFPEFIKLENIGAFINI
ncbi:UNVERIFIED_CONTAM: hypothetical protein HDU68_000287 [Siphonaria sp. JEL0065]|nr:hypothetical protein HDU68_000287 [Siphonaria sp. JEL0065]